MIMSLKQREIKFKPRIELNHNIYVKLKLSIITFKLKFEHIPLFFEVCYISISGQNWITLA